MINIPAVLVGNGSAFLLLIMLLLASRKTTQNRLPDNKLFLIMIFSALIQCINETITFLIDGNTLPGMYILSIILNSLLYINNIFFAFIWTAYADYKLFSDLKRLKQIYSFVAIPAIIIILGTVVNLFHPIFFAISPDNVYSRSSLNILTYIVTYFYLMYGVIIIYKNRNKGSRYLFLPALQFIFPIIIGSVIQFLFYGISVIWICLAISLTSIYINLQNEVAYTDPVSGMFTRQYLNRFLDLESHHSSQRKLLAAIMIDIDKFKNINDNFGHLIGDEAIRSTAMILHSCVSSPGFVTRFAGDEFVVIFYVNNQCEVEQIVEKIKDKTNEFNDTSEKPYSLRFSFGSGIFNHKTDTPNGFINRIDNEMYKDKSTK